MWILLQVGRISGIHPFSFWPHYVQWQSENYSRLAGAQESQGYSIIFIFH